MKFSFLLLVVTVELLLFLGKWKLSVLFLIFALKSFLSNRSSPSVYLLDFSCFRPPNFWRVPSASFIEHISKGNFHQESIDFMAQILTSSGQSEETCLPPSLHCLPPRTRQQDSLEEAQLVLFPVVDDLLARTNLSPQQIDFLIVNCSVFCSSPSLSSIIINKYSMRSDVRSYNLSGMGCGAGALAVDLARSLLKIHKNRNVLVLSTEILTPGWYSGNDRPKLFLNCFFRSGSAALLLTNREQFKESAKYRVIHTVRTQRAFEDRAYRAVFREEDEDGKIGVTLRRDLVQVVVEMVRYNITVLGSRILPLSEKFRYGLSIVWKRYVDNSTEIYAPNFKTRIQHFCLPVSGRPVIREIAKALKLEEVDIEPALMTLHRFGNQSSSSVWYELAYIETKERIKKGDRVWQLGKGTGAKCNSVILECNRTITGESTRGPWAYSGHQYPIPADAMSDDG